jgi:hypothetical protein
MTKVGADIGNFLNASVKISTISKEYELSGRIIINGLQMGGDPTQLAKILTGSIVSCDTNNIESCKKTAEEMIKYSSEYFPNQFSENASIWTTPLVPLGGFSKDHFVSDFGLILADSYVTNEVIEGRKYLLCEVRNSKNHVYGFQSMLTNYPIPAPKIEAYLEGYTSNLNLLSNNNGYSAFDCWKFPQKCVDIVNKYKSSKFKDGFPDSLNKLVNIKYGGGDALLFWPTGVESTYKEFLPQSRRISHPIFGFVFGSSDVVITFEEGNIPVFKTNEVDCSNKTENKCTLRVHFNILSEVVMYRDSYRYIEENPYLPNNLENC